MQKKNHRNAQNDPSCLFREEMVHGYLTFSSVKDPQKYLGFMRNGRPINYSNLKHDEKCRLIFKKEITKQNSSNDVTSVTSPIIYQETSTTTPRKSSRMQKTHSNRIDSSKPSRNNKVKMHHVRHRHNELPLRHPHSQHNNNNNNNFNINNNLNNFNLVKDRINSDRNNINDHDPYNNSVVNISDNPHHVRHHHGQNHQRHTVDDEIDGGAPCEDMTGVNVVKGNKTNNKKNVKKCNNRRNKKNNENAVRHTRKKSSHKQSANRTPEN